MENILFDIAEICGPGLHFKLDGFRLLYCIIAVFMWSMTGLLNPEYMAHYKNKTRYYVFTWITFLSTVGVFLSADFYTTFIFFEIMSFTSYVWVAQDEKKDSLRAAGTYLAVAVIGGLVMLMGIFLLYSITGTLNFDDLRLLYLTCQSTVLSKRIWAAGLCILFGFGAKAGAFPLHIWLPKAHPVAPAPASALLSGILTKAGVFGILILSCYIFEGDITWGSMILITGVITMFLGALLAIFSVDLKRTLACSSVSQIGFILTGIGMAGLLGEHNAVALRGSLLHMVNHSLIKLVLFMAAGVVYMNLHALDLNEVRGFGRKKPLLKIIFLIGALGIGGIPLFNGYVSKTLIHESIVEYSHLMEEGLISGLFTESAMTAIEWIFMVSGGFTVAYMTKLYVCLFVEKNLSEEKQKKYDDMKKYMKLPSATALTLSASVLPILGVIPNITSDSLADLSGSFLHVDENLRINYFSWESLKGGLISIAIGAALYLLIVRPLLMRKTEGGREYANRWPKWMDLENAIYRPILLYALPFVFGVACRALDSLTDGIVVFLRKTIYRDLPVKNERIEGTYFTELFGKLGNSFESLFNRFRKEKHEKDYKHAFAMEYEERRENRTIMFRSLSFGLILFCMGLLVTVVYLFVRYMF